MNPQGLLSVNQPLFPNPITPHGGHLTAARLLQRNQPDRTRVARAEVRKCIFHYIALLINILLAATTHLLIQQTPEDPEPYHTSLLTGQEWVMELIIGHPDRICCELGVHAEVFESLVNNLCSLGHGDSRHVSLEEQLAIFLYACVTGLTVRHIAERFQRSNDTISQFLVCKTLLETSTNPKSLISQVFLQDVIHFFVPSVLHNACLPSH